MKVLLWSDNCKYKNAEWIPHLFSWTSNRDFCPNVLETDLYWRVYFVVWESMRLFDAEYGATFTSAEEDA